VGNGKLGDKVGVGRYPIVWAVKVSNNKITKIKHITALDGCHAIFYMQQPTKIM
jgi:hypothetical protein